MTDENAAKKPTLFAAHKGSIEITGDIVNSDESQPRDDPLDAIELQLRTDMLYATRHAILCVLAATNEQNAARGLSLVEHISRTQRELLARVGGGVPLCKRRRHGIMVSSNPVAAGWSATYDDDSSDVEASEIGLAEPDNETFGAQALKMLTGLFQQGLGTLGGGGNNRDKAKRAEIELAEVALRSANLLGDNDLIASRRAVLRELLKAEDYVDGAGESEPMTTHVATE